VKAPVNHWRHRYDWRGCEAMLNDWGEYKTSIDGLRIHILHVRSKHENALPLIHHPWLAASPMAVGVQVEHRHGYNCLTAPQRMIAGRVIYGFDSQQ
jgi:hypothetical protein